MKKELLIIDDEPRLLELYARLLSLEGYVVQTASTAKEGFKFMEKNSFPVVLSDIRLPDENGIQLTRKIKSQFPHTEVILLTAYGNIPDCVQAMQYGAFHYLTKGDGDDQLIPLIEQAFEKALYKIRTEKNENQSIHFEDLIGASPAFRQAVQLGKQIAPTDTSVLLIGESGTGKELLAQAIHNEGKRTAHPFVAINCAAIPKEMLESELFGYKKGAFTGAVIDKKGLIEVADGGTLFLDEIGEMAYEMQAKLLRVLETKTFYKIGDTKSIQSDFRLISATHRNLQEAIHQNQFRADLYYRIAVFGIEIPPLRNRKEDIVDLCNYYIQRFANEFKKEIIGISPECLSLIQRYEWQGNIRELRNAMERAVILCPNQEEIQPYHLPQNITHQNSETQLTKVSIDLTLSNSEKHQIEKVLKLTQGNKPQAAQILGIGLTTLYRKIEEYQLS